MLIPLTTLISKFKIKVNNILHIGAHLCEEKLNYNEAGISDEQITWIEADNELFEKNLEQYPNIKIIQALISNEEKAPVYTIKIDTLINEKKIIIDTTNLFIAIDVPGTELLALKSMIILLPQVNYLYVKINSKQIKEIDNFVSTFGFARVTIQTGPDGCINAFYSHIKDEPLKNQLKPEKNHELLSEKELNEIGRAHV